MFKRQYYALEHSNRGDSASSSSSSSLATASDGEGGPDLEDDGAWPASSHESDSSSEEEVVEAEGATSVERTVAASDDESEDVAEGSDGEADGETSDIEPQDRKRKLSKQWAEAVDDDETDRVLDKFEGSSVICVGASNQVFKCRVCPKVVCLSEESMDAHLTSKGHARSLKQLAEGRLKVQLDSEGEEDEEGETHAERFARTLSTAQEEKITKRKRDSGRQRQRKRMKRKALLAEKKGKTEKEVLRAHSAASEVKRERQGLPTTGGQLIKGKVLKKKEKEVVAPAATDPNVAKNGSGYRQLPKSKKKNSLSEVRAGKGPKAKQKRLLSSAVSN